MQRYIISWLFEEDLISSSWTLHFQIYFYWSGKFSGRAKCRGKDWWSKIWACWMWHNYIHCPQKSYLGRLPLILVRQCLLYLALASEHFFLRLASEQFISYYNMQLEERKVRNELFSIIYILWYIGISQCLFISNWALILIWPCGTWQLRKIYNLRYYWPCGAWKIDSCKSYIWCSGNLFISLLLWIWSIIGSPCYVQNKKRFDL